MAVVKTCSCRPANTRIALYHEGLHQQELPRNEDTNRLEGIPMLPSSGLPEDSRAVRVDVREKKTLRASCSFPGMNSDFIIKSLFRTRQHPKLRSCYEFDG